MSFFLKENFNLLAGAFQNGISTEVEGDTGSVYQDETSGFIDTYADADMAILGCNEYLPFEEIRGTALKFTIKYKIISLPASDYVRILYVVDKETQPILGSLGTESFIAFVYNDAGTYYERWGYYTTADAFLKWNEGGSAWAAGGQNVRSISLDTWYTITITYDPTSNTVTFDNGTQSATTTACRITHNRWWYVGVDDTAVYGRMEFDYIKVEDTTSKLQWKDKWEMTTEGLVKHHFDGSAFKDVWNLVENYTAQWTDKYTLLDYDPAVTQWVDSYKLGEGESTIVKVDCSVVMDGVDISGSINSLSIKESETATFPVLTLQIKDKTTFRNFQPRIASDDDFAETRLTTTIDDETQTWYLDQVRESESQEFAGTFECRGAQAVLDRPFSQAVDYTTETDMTKKEIAEYFADSIDIEWNIESPIVPAGGFSVLGKSPIEAIQAIVTPSGGKVYCDGDGLVVEYEDHDLNKTPSFSLSSELIHSYDKRIVDPTGENCIMIIGYNPLNLGSGWASCVLYGSKSELKSNGNDWLTLLAFCYNEDGTPGDYTIETDETATPSEPNTISVGKEVVRLIGLWVDNGGAHGAAIDHSGYSVDGSTITIPNEEMAKVSHLVTYEGAETVSFTADQLASVSKTPVKVKGGFGETTLKASDGGGGRCIVEATYKGQTSNPLIIILDDPRIGSIDASAIPSSLQTSEIAKIVASVTDSNDDPVADGITVYFQVYQGDGTLSAETAETQTDTIEDEVAISSTPIRCSTRHPITSLTSIYRLDKGEPYLDLNYATGATVTNNSIELSTALPLNNTELRITYTSGGIAQVEYQASATVPFGGATDVIYATVGAEDARVEIQVDLPGGSGGGSLGGGGGVSKNYIDFRGTFKGAPGEGEGYAYKTEARLIDGVNMSDYKLEILKNAEDIDFIQGKEFYGGVTVDINLMSFEVTCKIYPAKELIQPKFTIVGGETWMEGTSKVLDKDTEKPIWGAAVVIFWDDDAPSSVPDVSTWAAVVIERASRTEYMTTNKAGEFTYRRGRPDGQKHTMWIGYDGDDKDYETEITEISLAAEAKDDTSLSFREVFYETPYWYRVFYELTRITDYRWESQFKPI